MSWNNGDIGDLHQYAEQLAAGVASAPGQDQDQDQSASTTKMATSHQQDALAIAQNGGLSGHDAVEEEDLEGEADDGMDDDMMDKMSSSPSIEDGGYTFTWPRRVDSLRPAVPRGGSPVPVEFSEAGSSCPYVVLPEHFPLEVGRQRASKDSAPCPRHHHLLLHGVYKEKEQRSGSDGSVNTITRRVDGEEAEQLEGEEEDGQDFAPPPADEGVGGLDEEEKAGEDGGDLTIPYETTDEDDDDGDFSLSDVDPRFVDSGWGGECLRNTEDIDFEFVYALHTFVATVEGQANATKGDTMVLLDDSNSYWWLVRVAKDSSIGVWSCCPLPFGG